MTITQCLTGFAEQAAPPPNGMSLVSPFTLCFKLIMTGTVSMNAEDGAAITAHEHESAAVGMRRSFLYLFTVVSVSTLCF